jgi:hypothetical protein
MPMEIGLIHDFRTINALLLPVKSYFTFAQALNVIRQLHISPGCDIKTPVKIMEVTELKSTISELSARVTQIRDWL